MSIVHEITLQCPICGTWFHSTALAGTRGRSRTTTDFHRCVHGVEPIAYEVHQCAACGFAAPSEEFAADEPDLHPARFTRAAETLPSSAALAGSDKYEAAAVVAERRGEGPLAVADLLLRAAWCCVAERDTEAERFFRRLAAMEFERALGRFDEVSPDRRVEITYLIGEQWRRIGDEARAREWLDRVAEEAGDDPAERWLVALAAQQRDRPREWLGERAA